MDQVQRKHNFAQVLQEPGIENTVRDGKAISASTVAGER
jgi:hypothetical protein